MPYRDENDEVTKGIIAENPFVPMLEVRGLVTHVETDEVDESAKLWEAVFNFLEEHTTLPERKIVVGLEFEREMEQLRKGELDTDALLALYAGKAVSLKGYITTQDVSDYYQEVITLYESSANQDEDDATKLKWSLAAMEELFVSQIPTKSMREHGLDETLQELKLYINERTLNHRDVMDQWVTNMTAPDMEGVVAPATASRWKLDDVKANWEWDQQTFGVNDSNRFLPDYMRYRLTETVIDRGGLPTRQKITSVQKLAEALRQQGVDSSIFGDEQKSIMQEYASNLQFHLGLAQGLHNQQQKELRPGEPGYGQPPGELPQAKQDEITNKVIQDLIFDVLNPEKAKLTPERLKDLFNNAALRNLGTVLGDLDGLAATDEQYLARVAYKQVLDQIDAAAAQGVARENIDVTGLGD